MKVAIFGHKLNALASCDALVAVLHVLQKNNVEVLVYESFFNEVANDIKSYDIKTFRTYEDIIEKVQFMFSIGGDGTLLEAVTLVRDANIPVMGINVGRLGFLSSISPAEIASAVQLVLDGKYSLDKRTLLELDSATDKFVDCKYALNEIAVQKTDSSSMIIIHASLNGKFLNSYWADGLIIATPTGSTAYSLSCGGPIVMPNSDNFVITPVSPHNLNVRPIIVSSNDVITLEIKGRSNSFLVSLDSRSENVPTSLSIKIKKAAFQLSLVKLDNHDFLSTLREKLMWGADKRN